MIQKCYLHTNGKIIFKSGVITIEDDSPFIQKAWVIDAENRGHAWSMLIDAAALGANKDQVAHLIQLWELTDKDGLIYLNTYDFCPHIILDRTTKGIWILTDEHNRQGYDITIFKALTNLRVAVYHEIKKTDNTTITTNKYMS